MRDLRAGATSLSAAAVAAAALASCAPVLHDADLVRATPVRSSDTGVTRADSAYANALGAIERRDYARALEQLQIARQQSAGDVRVLNAMGVVYDKLGRFDLSRRYYAQAAKADPNSPIVQANIAYSQRLQDGSSGVQFAQAPVIQVSPPAPLRQIEAVAAVNAPRIADLSSPAPPPIAALDPPPPPPATTAVMGHLRGQPAAVASPSAPPDRLEFVALIRARAVAGLSRLAALRIDEMDAPAPQAAVVRLATPKLRPTTTGPQLAVARWQPLRVINATGHLHRAEPIRASLAGLGWSAPRWAMAEAGPRTRTVIIYPPSRARVAKALARTLPGSVQLAICADGCAGLQLVLGADARTWKPMPRPIIRTAGRNRTA